MAIDFKSPPGQATASEFDWTLFGYDLSQHPVALVAGLAVVLVLLGAGRQSRRRRDNSPGPGWWDFGSDDGCGGDGD